MRQEAGEVVNSREEREGGNKEQGEGDRREWGK